MNNSSVQVRQATVEDLDVLVPLFDAYRQFYRHASDAARARQFLLDRFEHSQSVVFLAFDGPRAVGFTQLYPSFSSGLLTRTFIVNDLFVAPEARRRGVASVLLRKAADYGQRVNASQLTLATAVTNTTAQSVYEGLGWKRDTVFFKYQLELGAS